VGAELQKITEVARRLRSEALHLAHSSLAAALEQEIEGFVADEARSGRLARPA